jgi:hypothetical protein
MRFMVFPEVSKRLPKARRRFISRIQDGVCVVVDNYSPDKPQVNVGFVWWAPFAIAWGIWFGWFREIGKRRK